MSNPTIYDQLPMPWLRCWKLVKCGWLAGRHQSLPLTYLVPIVHCLGIG